MCATQPGPLAEPTDYTSVYGPVDDQARLGALLARASRIVRDELAADGYDLAAMMEAGTIRADTAADVVVDMVAYALRTTASGGFAPPVGATQASMTAGPYSRSATFSAAVGSLSFTKVHRKRLGIKRPGAFSVDLLGGGAT